MHISTDVIQNHALYSCAALATVMPMTVTRDVPVSFLAVLAIACNIKATEGLNFNHIASVGGCPAQFANWGAFVANNVLLSLMATTYRDNPVFLARLYVVACAVEAGIWYKPGETWRIIAMRLCRQFRQETRSV
jgi:hypothetical protein